MFGQSWVSIFLSYSRLCLLKHQIHPWIENAFYTYRGHSYSYTKQNRGKESNFLKSFFFVFLRRVKKLLSEKVLANISLTLVFKLTSVPGPLLAGLSQLENQDCFNTRGGELCWESQVLAEEKWNTRCREYQQIFILELFCYALGNSTL